MGAEANFATAPISNLFNHEVKQLGGEVLNTFDDGKRLFARAILSDFLPVEKDDRVQAGVAMRADENQVSVHPYVFRLVCKNGAIWAHTLEAVTIPVPAELSHSALSSQVADAIRSCAAPQVFTLSVAQMRSARLTGIEMALHFAAILSNSDSGYASVILSIIQEHQENGADQSTYGLMNAITAAARDSVDPEMQWRLEEFGACVPAGKVPSWLEIGDECEPDYQAMMDRLQTLSDVRCGFEDDRQLVGAMR